MWFVLLAITLLLLTLGGIYFRRRLLWSLETLGAGTAPRRAVGFGVPWLLFSLPLVVTAWILFWIVSGSDALWRPSSPLVDWLLVYPFWIAVLVMFQCVPLYLIADALRFIPAVRVRLSQRHLALGILALACAFAVYTPLRILYDAGDLNIQRFQVGKGTSGNVLKLVFFADLQVNQQTDDDKAAEAVSLMNREKADLVLVGGDWVNNEAVHIPVAARAAAKLESRLGVLSVRGDHEHFLYRDQDRSAREVERQLAEVGVPLLDNEVRFYEHQGAKVAVIFLSYHYVYRTPAGEIERLLAQAAEADYSILLSHQFDDALGEIIRNRVDLALFGHTHGGQVNPFLLLGHVSPARVETPFVSGRYQLGKTEVIVTSGIGFSIAPFRYASPATIEVIEIAL